MNIYEVMTNKNHVGPHSIELRLKQDVCLKLFRFSAGNSTANHLNNYSNVQKVASNFRVARTPVDNRSPWLHTDFSH